MLRFSALDSAKAQQQAIGWFLKLIKLSITTALTVVAIIILLKFGFGIDSGTVWQAIINIPQTIYTLINN